LRGCGQAKSDATGQISGDGHDQGHYDGNREDRHGNALEGVAALLLKLVPRDEEQANKDDGDGTNRAAQLEIAVPGYESHDSRKGDAGHNPVLENEFDQPSDEIEDLPNAVANGLEEFPNLGPRGPAEQRDCTAAEAEAKHQPQKRYAVEHGAPPPI